MFILFLSPVSWHNNLLFLLISKERHFKLGCEPQVNIPDKFERSIRERRTFLSFWYIRERHIILSFWDFWVLILSPAASFPRHAHVFFSAPASMPLPPSSPASDTGTASDVPVVCVVTGPEKEHGSCKVEEFVAFGLCGKKVHNMCLVSQIGIKLQLNYLI